MEPIISVIMPVYNVEDYVAQAIESIRKQTFQDWEFLIVDDGTPDRSGEICDEIAKTDSRIRVFHKENGGAPSARNHAMQFAKGQYYYFMDSDDWAEPTMLEDMYNLASKENAQLVVAGFFIDTYYTDTEKYTQIQRHAAVNYESQQAFREGAHELFDVNLLYTPWNKLFEAKYLKDHNILFPQTFWDDFPFNLSVVRDVERVCVIDQPYYHFIRKRAESETAKYRDNMYEKREEENEWMLELYRHWGVSSAESREFIARRYIERIVGCVENLTNSACDLSASQKKQEIKKIISSDAVREALKIAKPKSGYMKLMLLPIRWKSSGLTYLEGKVISGVKSNNTRLFAKLKAER